MINKNAIIFYQKNMSKHHLLISRFKYENVWEKIGKAGKKLCVLARLSNFMCTNQKIK